jgi:xylulokinase
MVPDPDPIPAWLGLDVGTSAVKALLADAAGHTLARCSEALALAAPTALAAEQEAEDWWAAAVRAITGCLGARPEARVEAVGLTGQKHGLLALGPGGEPLAPARLWADGRAVVQAGEMARRVPRLGQRTGAPALPGYLVPKWMHWSSHDPRAAARTRHLCFVKDFLRLRLTGAYATDPTEASASQLWDAARGSWSPSLCAVFGVPLAALPPVVACVDATGTVTAQAAAATGLPAGASVVAGAGDNEAAALACGALAEGTVAVALGTSGTVVAPAARRGGGRGLVWGRGVLRRGTVATGVVLSAGRALEWIRAVAFPETAGVGDVLAAAGRVEHEEGLPLFLPSLAGERSPVPDAEASAAFVGLRPRHTRAHLAAAVLGGVAATLGEVIESLRRAGVSVGELRLTSGGAASRRLRQLVAAAARSPARWVGEDEGPARGAALLARCLGASDAVLAETAATWVRPGPQEVPDEPDVLRMGTIRQRLDALRRLRL